MTRTNPVERAEKEYLTKIARLKEELKSERNSNEILKELFHAMKRNLSVSRAPEELLAEKGTGEAFMMV